MKIHHWMGEFHGRVNCLASCRIGPLMPNLPIVYKARFVFPVAAPPIPDGYVTVRDQRIVAVGDGAPGDCQIIDLENSAIVPGLVNAHTHLEFSQLAAPLGHAGMALPDWILLVIHWRRNERTLVEEAVSAGLAESAHCGTTTIGEIATIGWSPAPWEAAGIRAVVFRELLGFSPETVAARLAVARDFLKLLARQARCLPGLSPHAPYSVHPELLRGAVRLAREVNVPVAMHLAESAEELELLSSGSGKFQKLLADLGMWQADTLPRSLRPLDYLRELSAAPRAVVVHGNYLDDEEMDFLAAQAGRMGLVYCPRTHVYFRHAPYPLAKLLSRGVTVGLGTDSRASNPDLNLWEEMRFVAQQDVVPPAKVLEMGTLGGARVLGLDAELGTLTAGKRADMCAVELPPHDETDPHELLFSTSTCCTACPAAG